MTFQLSDRMARPETPSKRNPAFESFVREQRMDGALQSSAMGSGPQDVQDLGNALRPLLTAYLYVIRGLIDFLKQRSAEVGGAVGMPMPVEPDGGIGDGAGPIPGAGKPGIPDATTLAVGEEDGGGPIPVEPDGGIGDGAGPISGDPDGPSFTTLAIGEEDGGGPIPVEPDGGIGDGAGPIPGGPMPVEPDGGIGDGAGPIPQPDTGPIPAGPVFGNPEPPEATTLAIGEEDGGGPFPAPWDSRIGNGKPAPPFEATTLALGEEDGGSAR